MKVRKGFLYALFGIGQLAAIYWLCVLCYFIGTQVEPTLQWPQQMGVGALLLLGALFIALATIAIGIGICCWGKWTFEMASKCARKLENYLVLRARLAEDRRWEKEYRARKAAEEAEAVIWEA